MKHLRLTTRQTFVERLKKNKKNTKAYFLTGLTEDEKAKLYMAKANGTLAELSLELGFDCQGILMIGDSKETKGEGLTSYVGYFRGPITDGNVEKLNENRPIHYRLYTLTEEIQDSNKHLINHCPDVRVSVKSAVQCIKDRYIVLRYEVVESELEFVEKYVKLS